MTRERHLVTHCTVLPKDAGTVRHGGADAASARYHVRSRVAVPLPYPERQEDQRAAVRRTCVTSSI